MAFRLVVCIPVATVVLLSLALVTLAAPTVHLGPPLQESQSPTGAHGNGVQHSPHHNSVADRPYIVEPTWFTVTTSPIDDGGDAAAGQLTGRVGMPVLPVQPATMRPYVAYIPIAPAYRPHHLPPGWPAYLPGVLPTYPMPPHNHFCNQPSPSGYQLM